MLRSVPDRGAREDVEDEGVKAKRRVLRDADMARRLILEATQQLMVTEGYASVSTRRVATSVDMPVGLVHYYYPTTDDLLLASYRHAIQTYDAGLRVALTADKPLLSLWKFCSDSRRMALGVEFQAMANHRKVIRAEIRKHSERDRLTQAQLLAEMLAAQGKELAGCSALCAATFILVTSRGLVMDDLLGISSGHVETKAFVENLIAGLEVPAKAKATR